MAAAGSGCAARVAPAMWPLQLRGLAAGWLRGGAWWQLWRVGFAAQAAAPVAGMAAPLLLTACLAAWAPVAGMAAPLLLTACLAAWAAWAVMAWTAVFSAACVELMCWRHATAFCRFVQRHVPLPWQLLLLRAALSTGASGSARVWMAVDAAVAVGLCLMLVVGVCGACMLPPARRGGVQVFVRTLSGRTVTVLAAPEDPAAVLLTSPAVTGGAPPHLLRMMWRSRCVRLEQTLAWHGIVHGSTVFATSVLLGGVGVMGADVRRVSTAVQALAAADPVALSHMEAGRWDAVLAQLVRRSGVAEEVAAAVVSEHGGALMGSVAAGKLTARMWVARRTTHAAPAMAAVVARTAADAPVAAGAGGGAAATAPSALSAAPPSSMTAGSAPAGGAAVAAAHGTTPATYCGSGRNVRCSMTHHSTQETRAQLAALKRLAQQGDAGAHIGNTAAAAQACTPSVDAGSAPAAATTSDAAAVAGHAAGATLAASGSSEVRHGRHLVEMLAAVAAVVRADPALRVIADRLTVRLEAQGEAAQLAAALQARLPPPLRCASVECMRKWLFRHKCEVELALATAGDPDVPAAAGERASATGAAADEVAAEGRSRQAG